MCISHNLMTPKRKPGSPVILLYSGLIIATFANAAYAQQVRYYPVPQGSHPHDVAPAPDGTVWYTAQARGALGRLDPRTGKIDQIPLGSGSAPHGVIIGPDKAAWVTDGGQNAIVRVDPATRAVKIYPLPKGSRYGNLNTAAFDGKGILWFTGQSGIYGCLDPKTGHLEVYDAPRGRGPYGMTGTPNGEIYFASLAGNYVARIDTVTGKAQVIEPPTKGQGARRVWSDSTGRIWVSEWNSGRVSVYDPKTSGWQSWKLPGDSPLAYAVYVDEKDVVWLTDFGSNAIVRFDPKSGAFKSFPGDRRGANVRQLLGRPGEVWGAESGNDRLVLIEVK
jgi:virginiamycin B lyase